MTSPASLARLVRAPAALTVPGDSLAGAAAANWPFGRRTPALAVAATCLYWSGMALNDWADRDLDARERPERPIPAGEVSPPLALAVASTLTVAGLCVAAAAGGRRALAVAVPLAVTVWAYDLALKATPLGPPAMALARGLDVLLGAGAGSLRAATPAAATIGAHVLGVTVLSRAEVRGTSPALPLAALVGTAGVAAAAAPRVGESPGAATRPATAAALAVFGGLVGSAQVGAVRRPDAGHVRAAVGAGILGLIPLQAALLARSGAPVLAAGVCTVLPLARRLSRRVSPT